MRKARQRLEDNEIDSEEVLLIGEEAFDDALVGTTLMTELRAVYDYNKMVDAYAKAKGCSEEEAADYICYNILRSLPFYGDKAPIVVDFFIV